MIQKPSQSDVAAAAQQVPGELLKLGINLIHSPDGCRSSGRVYFTKL
jgi:hypothetical protein